MGVIARITVLGVAMEADHVLPSPLHPAGGLIALPQHLTNTPGATQPLRIATDLITTLLQSLTDAPSAA